MEAPSRERGLPRTKGSAQVSLKRARTVAKMRREVRGNRLIHVVSFTGKGRRKGGEEGKEHEFLKGLSKAAGFSK